MQVTKNGGGAQEPAPRLKVSGIAAGAVGIFMSAIALTAMVGVAGAFRTFVTAAVGDFIGNFRERDIDFGEGVGI